MMTSQHVPTKRLRRFSRYCLIMTVFGVGPAACTNVPVDSEDDDTYATASSSSASSSSSSSSASSASAGGTGGAGAAGGAGGATSSQSSSVSSTASSGGMGGGNPNPNCGDFLVQAGEDCDDGNTMAGDGCDASCKKEAYTCGNSKTEPGEQCDDGNNMGGDKCDANCQLEQGDVCGDALDLNASLVNGSYSGDTTNKGNVNFGDPSCDTDMAAMSDAVVHRYTASQTASYTFKTVAPMAGAMNDTVLWAYNDCLNASGATQIACNDDYDFQHYFSNITRVLEKDETLFVVIAGSTYQNSAAAGPYTLTVAQNGTCGDGMTDVGEQCDDGNNSPADGCDPMCAFEITMLEMESNNTFGMANAATGPLAHATIDPSGDEDYYAITVKADEIVTAQLLSSFDNSCGIGTTMSLGDVDSELELLASDGTTSIAFEDEYYCSYLSTGVPSAGTYYVRVAASTTYCPGCRFAYKLLVETKAAPPPPAGDPWINELHYDNTGGDQNEFVELAGPAGLDMSGWLLIAYNGSNGKKYETINLSGVIPDQQNGYGTLAFDFGSLQNGAPDGVALVDGNNNNSVISFISYEGDFVATDGEAQGAMSMDIGVSEPSSTPVGDSLYMVGTGNQQASFTWAPATAAHTKGMVNTGQTFQ